MKLLPKKVWEAARRGTDKEALELAKVLGYELPMYTKLGLLTVESTITPHGKRYFVVHYSEFNGRVVRAVLEFAYNSTWTSMSFSSARDALRAIVDARYHRPQTYGYIEIDSIGHVPKKSRLRRFLAWIRKKLKV